MTTPLTLQYRAFTGTTEPDPHRVAFWAITLSEEGLALGLEHVPPGTEQRTTISWADLHAILGQRDALLDEVEALEEERTSLAQSLARLRVAYRRTAAGQPPP